MASGNFKDLTRITASEKLLLDEAFNIAKSPKHDGYQKSLVYKFFDKKNFDGTVKNKNMTDQEFAEK